MDSHQLAKLVDRLKRGIITPGEQEQLNSFWEKSLQDDSGLKELPSNEQEQLRLKMYSSISGRIDFAASGHKQNRAMALYKIAASITLLVVATIFLYTQYSDISPTAVAENRYVELRTKFGEQLTVHLPDNSSVVLNGNSTLKYLAHWTAGIEREVWITGEGFFAVQHTSNNQRFVVHTQEGLNVEVLGTKFNVKSRGERAEVLLTEGRVKLNHMSEPKDEFILQPGEMATVEEKKLLKRTVENKKYTSWVSGKLYFNKTTLLEISEMLADTYGMRVTFQNENLKSRQLSGEIYSASIDDILLAIAETFHVEVTRQGTNGVVFSSKSE
jgi:ferric-dicitrate binding protein FerR (iron transport regulator)